MAKYIDGQDFWPILVLLISFSIALVPCGFLLCSFFDTIETAQQIALGIMIGEKLANSMVILTGFTPHLITIAGLYAVFYVFDSLGDFQTMAWILPPIELQVGLLRLCTSPVSNWTILKTGGYLVILFIPPPHLPSPFSD